MKMKKMFKKLQYLPVVIAIGLLGFVGLANADETPIPPGGVPVESSLAVSNASTGGGYHDAITAVSGNVVNIQVWYHNPQPAASNEVAHDVNVRINLPGTSTTTHAITSRVAGSNTNVTTDIANVNTSINTTLAYIPGTANRRYNAGTNDVPNWVNLSLPDSIVTSGYTVTNLNPCWNFAETITIQARVMAPSVSIKKQVKIEGAETWLDSVEARPGDLLAYLITVKNEGNTTLNNLVVRDNLPPRLDYIEGSARLINGNHPVPGMVASDNVIAGGTIIGNYAPGTIAYVRFNARVPLTMPEFTCYTFDNVGVTRADSLGEYYDTAAARVCYARTSEEIELRIVKFNDANGNRTQDGGELNLSGWNFQVTGPSFNQTVTTDSTGYAYVRGLNPGTYSVTEQLKSGWTNTTGLSITRNVTTDVSTQTFVFGNRQVTPPPTPPSGGEVTLPTSGPIETASATLASMFATGGLLSYVRSKKLLKKASKKY